MKFLTKSGVEVRVTCPANLSCYLCRKEGTYLRAGCEDRNVQLRIPQLHAIGQPKPPKGRGWAGAVNVVIGRFSQPFPKALSRQRVQIKAQYPRPYRVGRQSSSIAG